MMMGATYASHKVLQALEDAIAHTPTAPKSAGAGAAAARPPASGGGGSAKTPSASCTTASVPKRKREDESSDSNSKSNPKVAQLTAMGFSAEQAEVALVSTGQNVAAAINILLASAPAPAPTRPSAPAPAAISGASKDAPAYIYISDDASAADDDDDKKAAPAKKKVKKAAVSAAQKREVLDALEDRMRSLKREIAVAQGEYDEAYIREECGEHGGVLCSAEGCGQVGSYDADGELAGDEDEDGSWRM